MLPKRPRSYVEFARARAAYGSRGDFFLKKLARLFGGNIYCCMLFNIAEVNTFNNFIISRSLKKEWAFRESFVIC